MGVGGLYGVEGAGAQDASIAALVSVAMRIFIVRFIFFLYIVID
jgi:hypothetical protein